MKDTVRGRLPWTWWEVLLSLAYVGVYGCLLSHTWEEFETFGASVRTVFSLGLISSLTLLCLISVVVSFVFRVDTLRLARDFIRIRRGSSLWMPHQVQTTKAEKGFFLMRATLLTAPFCHTLANRLVNLQQEGGTFLAVVGVVAASFLFVLYGACWVLMSQQFWGRA